MITIREFYKDQDIFLTGGSGFMGKVLIEKLLRSCSELNRIYVLLREKKGKSYEQRLKDILNTPLFERLREENPSILEKVIAIEGDVTLLNLGISKDNEKLLENVSIIFHAAASVRFDDPLKSAIILNTRGTREVMKLGEKLKNLKVIMHVSTTYCNPDQHVIDEKIYPPYADWQEAIKFAETFDNETLNILNAKFSNYQPNTYTFTKSLAEHVVNDYREKLPVSIFRPSIVISSIEEPMPGWIDNFNGPVGMFLACGLGVLRTMYGDPDVVSDFVPVDIAIKGMVISAFEQGTTGKQSDLAIYNCTTSSLRSETTGRIIELAKEINRELPIDKMLWVPGGGITRSRLFNFIRFMLFHVIVAVVVDSIFRLINQKPFLVKLQRKIYAANLALHYFATTRWTFINNNFMALENVIPPTDMRSFTFLHLKDTDIKLYFYNAMDGARKYLLHENDQDLKNAKKKYWKIYVLDKILKCVFLYLCGYIILVKFKLWSYLKQF